MWLARSWGCRTQKNARKNSCRLGAFRILLRENIEARADVPTDRIGAHAKELCEIAVNEQDGSSECHCRDVGIITSSHEAKILKYAIFCCLCVERPSAVHYIADYDSYRISDNVS